MVVGRDGAVVFFGMGSTFASLQASEQFPRNVFSCNWRYWCVNTVVNSSAQFLRTTAPLRTDITHPDANILHCNVAARDGRWGHVTLVDLGVSRKDINQQAVSLSSAMGK